MTIVAICTRLNTPEGIIAPNVPAKYDGCSNDDRTHFSHRHRKGALYIQPINALLTEAVE